MTYDEFGFEESWSEAPEVSPPDAAPELPRVPMREQFPEAGSDYMGGYSNGLEYRSTFAGSNLGATFDMVREFLQEEGYGDVLLPANAEELRPFKKPRHAQLLMFEERGYMHCPVKILFPSPGSKQRNALTLVVFNEKAAGYLLRFHGLLSD